jgi:hypothetical protein
MRICVSGKHCFTASRSGQLSSRKKGNRLSAQRENGFLRDRHAKSTRDKKGREERKEIREQEKGTFVQDFEVLRGFCAGLLKIYAHSTFFCSSMQSVVMGVDR